MIMKANSAGVLGTGHYAPEKIVTNADLEKMVDTSDEWIQTRTGIKQRHFASEGMNTSDMCTKAAEQALEMAHTSPEELDMIIVCTLTPDMTIPSTACIVQKNLGAKNAAVFDLYAACSGFAYGSITAAQYIQSGMCKKVLVIGAEILSRFMDFTDRNTCVLFGDERTEPVAKLFAERLHVVYACRAKVEHRVIVGCRVLNVEQGGADGQRLGVVA